MRYAPVLFTAVALLRGTPDPLAAQLARTPGAGGPAPAAPPRGSAVALLFARPATLAAVAAAGDTLALEPDESRNTL